MTRQELKAELEKIWDKLDELQEEDIAQDDSDLLWDIGEALGATQNAIDDLTPRVNED